MEYKKPENTNYIAEGNVIVSLEEYNKLNTAMENLKYDQKTLSFEQSKLNKAIKENCFIYREVTHSRYGYYSSEPYVEYTVHKDAEKLIEPVVQQRVKKQMKEVYKEFSDIGFKDFLQWRKSYKESFIDG